ncbi:MAG: hypothetical protein JWQ07_1455 [Ramlibacter sp.]|nr:hypothetical protein [Ramlibacter sp.]
MSAHDDFDTPDLDQAYALLSRADVRDEDTHWEHAFSRERYYQPGLDYEDYAPAYCVGYIGFVQYGGEFDHAERSLCANWERIKGDSRLSIEEALQAIRAAWDRMAGEGELAVSMPAYGAVGSVASARA